jgi:hypothetical protein
MIHLPKRPLAPLKFLKKLGPQGQTAVEYLLIMAVSVGLGITIFKKLQDYLVNNPNSYLNSQLNYYRSQLRPEEGLKRYRLPR